MHHFIILASRYDWLSIILGLYSSAIFCSRYGQLIIVMLAIILVTVEQCDRNGQVSYMCPYKFMTCVWEHTMHVCTQLEQLLPLSVFKTHDKMRRWGCFLVDFWPCKFIKICKRCWGWPLLFCASNRYHFQHEILWLNKHRE